jgi:hypothetical protein
MERLRPVYWLRWLWGLFRFVVRRSPSPSILRHEIQRLDPALMRASARSGEPFALRLGGEQHNITVQAAPVADANPAVIVDGGDTPAQQPPSTVVFAGAVRGDPDSDVRLTITDDLVLGYVRTGHAWFWIEPLRRFSASAPPSEHIVYRAQDAVFRVPLGSDAPAGGTEEPGPSGSDHRVNPDVGIAVWGDTGFSDEAEKIGLSWPAAQATLVNLVNGPYESELGIRFVIRAFVLHVGSSLSSNAPGDLLDQFGVRVRAVHGDIRQVSVRQATNIEVAHLLTGRNLNGSTIGIAWNLGAWGLAEHHYVPSGSWLMDLLNSQLSYRNMLISAHEIGHNFTGDHDHADKICVAEFIVCWDYERTIMWPTLYSDNRDDFSDENSKRILDNAQNGRNVNFTHP